MSGKQYKCTNKFREKIDVVNIIFTVLTGVRSVLDEVQVSNDGCEVFVTN